MKTNEYLTEANVGQWVTYKPDGTRGRILGFHNGARIAFVVFRADGDLDTDRFNQYTGESVRYADLMLGGRQNL